MNALDRMLTNTRIVEDPPGDPAGIPTVELVARIVERNHAALRPQIANIEPLAAKVARVHGDHDPRLREVHELFVELRALLDPHLDATERMLFPALVAAAPDRKLIGSEALLVRRDHEAALALVAKLSALTDGFAPPSWACNSYRTLLRELAALEANVQKLSHLVGGVLLPRFA